MDMSFYAPVSIMTGKGCLLNGGAVFQKAGNCCLIVTGESAAKKSGALDDLVSVLDSVGVRHALFDRIEQNPSYQTCLAAAEMAKELGADFIVGVGGGSPLDAAKAVAVLTACHNTSEEVMYSNRWDARPLPVVAIGTTAGTGSEVTPVAVITSSEGMKKSIRSPALFPIAAFGDATYTLSLSPEFTRSTALDALAHCLESYFNRTANDISRSFALRGIEILKKMLERTAVADEAPLTLPEREELYCASLYGGLAISVTGTALPHALGYFLSEQYGIPHGNACAVYLETFIRHSVSYAEEEAVRLFGAIGIGEESLIALIKKNLPALGITLTEDKITELAPRFQNHQSFAKCYGKVDGEYATSLLRMFFL
ncbi:MAG: iron-containing alcohol dehydrogenase [Clostridia bacterium]|nr:iron-containing alcohol dehydrogenase [Clostridia bacterium]